MFLHVRVISIRYSLFFFDVSFYMNNKPTSTTVLEPTEIAVTQTIIRAQNGDVIVADETGLRMRLSDRVIEDIAMRLGKSGHGFGAMPQRDDTNNFLGDVDPSSQAEELSYFIGENIDCWDIQQRGEFASFMVDLPGRQGVRGFLKHLKGGGIIADTAGPLQTILAIGGTRAALAENGYNERFNGTRGPHFMLQWRYTEVF